MPCHKPMNTIDQPQFKSELMPCEPWDDCLSYTGSILPIGCSNSHSRPNDAGHQGWAYVLLEWVALVWVHLPCQQQLDCSPSSSYLPSAHLLPGLGAELKLKGPSQCLCTWFRMSYHRSRVDSNSSLFARVLFHHDAVHQHICRPEPGGQASGSLRSGRLYWIRRLLLRCHGGAVQVLPASPMKLEDFPAGPSVSLQPSSDLQADYENMDMPSWLAWASADGTGCLKIERFCTVRSHPISMAIEVNFPVSARPLQSTWRGMGSASSMNPFMTWTAA